MSPRPSIMTAVTLRTNSGAVSGTILRMLRLLVAAAGIFTSERFASALSMAAKFLFTTSAPFRAYVFSVSFLIAAIASSRGSTPESAKKQVCRIVLLRAPSPRSNATLDASTTKIFSFLAMICCWTLPGSSSQTLSGP